MATEWTQVGLRVAEARGASGLTQAELARRMKLDRTAVAKIERGRRGITALELTALAVELGRPIEYFVSDPAPSVISRRSAAVGPADLDVAVETFARDVELLMELGALRPISAPTANRPENPAEAEAFAHRVRQLLELGEGPLLGLDSIVEQAGLFTAALELGPERPDGAYVALEGAGAAVVNASHPAGRRRFTLAHEFGHHLMADEYATDWAVSESREDRERLINVFAVHFLMPGQAVSRDWTRWSGDLEQRSAAVRLAQQYRMSWTAVCGQLINLGLVDRESGQALASWPPSRAEHLEVGGTVVEELVPPRVSPVFARAALKSFRGHMLGRTRAVELLRGMVELDDLPDVNDVPAEALRGEIGP